MYHFTRVVAASRAVDDGLAVNVTPNDLLQVPGVWLSPNIYGSGSNGSFFGPIGLGIANAHLAGCACVYIGPNPRYRRRHRFLLLPNGVALPADVKPQNPPPGLPSATSPCELLLLGDVPAAQIDGVVFGNDQAITEREAQLEHARFFAHLLAQQHRLLGVIQYPHSTGEAVYGGWWTFRKLRNLLSEEARGDVAATPATMQAVLSRVVTHGLGGRAGLLGLSAESVRRWVTDEYATVFRKWTGNALDLTDNRE